VKLNPGTTDRRRGAILGLAIGDALGAAVESQPTGSFEEVTGYRDGGPHGLDRGEWTDDTSMALDLADSIAEVGWDLEDQAKRYVSWYRTGKYSVNGRVFDIGITTVRTLHTFRETGDPWTSGDPSPRASGNGSIMRLAPVPVANFRMFPAQLDLHYRQAVLRAVNLGDDADTTGAVCGQLAGAWFGESGIPSEWLEGLAGKDQIEPILGRLIS
jgi:ADP-ribosylglycohydrolase